MDVLEQMKSKISEIARLKEEMLQDLRQNFSEIVKPFFDNLPETITSLGWTQYSPYFNDGDDCVFSVNCSIDYGIRVNGEYLDEVCEELLGVNSIYGFSRYLRNDGSYEKWIEEYPEDKIDTDSIALDIYKRLSEFSDLITSIPEETLEDLFGNHVEVVINRDGSVETQEYEHD